MGRFEPHWTQNYEHNDEGRSDMTRYQARPLSMNEAALLEAFLQWLTDRQWPVAAEAFCADHAYTAEDLHEAWSTLAKIGGVDEPEIEDFDW